MVPEPGGDTTRGGNARLSFTPQSPQSTPSAAGHPGGGCPIRGARASPNARPAERLLVAALLSRSGVFFWDGLDFDGGGGNGGISRSRNKCAANGDGDKSWPSYNTAALSDQSLNLAALRTEHRARADAARKADCTTIMARWRSKRWYPRRRACTRPSSHRRSCKDNAKQKVGTGGGG